MITFGRYVIRFLPQESWGFWFHTFKLDLFQGEIRYITLGFGCIAFYVGDPISARANREVLLDCWEERYNEWKSKGML